MQNHISNETITFTREQARQTIISANASGAVFTLEDFMNDLELRLFGSMRSETYIPTVDEMSALEGRALVIAILNTQSLATQTACPCGRPCTYGEQLDILTYAVDSPHEVKITDHYLRRAQYLQEMAEANLVVVV